MLPNLLTSFNLGFGLTAILLALSGQVFLPCALIAASAFFDTLDGWAARRLGCETRFGAFFDSAADFVSFGLAPVFVFHAAEGDLRLLVALGLVFYVTASAFRLVRFHASRSSRAMGTFEGLPTTASALIFVGSIWLMPSAWTAWLLSFLMISRIPFSKALF